jgi:hypothetical protein
MLEDLAVESASRSFLSKLSQLPLAKGLPGFYVGCLGSTASAESVRDVGRSD